MTKEEEAIEYLKEHINYFKEQIKFIEAVGCDYYDEEYELYKNRVKQFETVLNMLKEKDAKIEHLEEKRNNQKQELAILNEKQKEMNKLINTVSSYKGMFKRQQKDQEKKDKINKLLMDFIYKMSIIRPGTIMYDLKEDGFDISECENCKGKSCRDCIKQYFERKATNNG